jgi:hypothetical protein
MSEKSTAKAIGTKAARPTKSTIPTATVANTLNGIVPGPADRELADLTSSDVVLIDAALCCYACLHDRVAPESRKYVNSLPVHW